ncbi:hypothetical protein CGCS363_v010723 [Colletotrichum siamense]|uniref:uncharacterized protein n=1 Tax=Colletotrichum siamense TaxID=690259 RepID=UPI001872FA9F|nr:uncharacterized protein CGCS363_v010723 [Colletotrichum siamense]KAF5491952.1 hypothetical protein CGCS363_v010723 [Colletotrichum siamense]
MRVSVLLSLGALLTSTIAITSTTILTPVEQSPYYYLGCYPYTAETAIGAYDIPNIATGYNNGNPVDCQIGCDQQFHAPYVFMYGTYCYCQVREFEFDIHQPGGAPVDNSLCTTPCFVDPNAPCGTLSNTDAGRYVTVYGKYGPRASFSPRVSPTSSTRSTAVTSSSIRTIASTSTSSTPQSRSLTPLPRPPYSYLGCYSFVSVQSGAIWQFQGTAVGDPVACQAACDAAGSPFLMMLFDSCYCQPASAGINAPPGLPAADSECSIACRNSPGSPCGGSASGLFYTVYGGRQPGVSSSNTLPLTASRLTSTRTSMSSASPSASLFPDPLPPYNYVGCYYMLSICNTDVFTLQSDILGNPAACQARCLDRLRSHFVTLVGTNLDLFYEPKQHDSGFKVLNVYIHHNSEVLNVLIHENNRQHLTVFCEPITRSHVFQYLDVSLIWFIGHHKPIILRIVSYTQLQHNGFVGIAVTDVSRYICRFSKSDIIRHYVGPVFKRFHLAGNHFPADQLFLDFNDDTDDGQYCSSTKRVDK